MLVLFENLTTPVCMLVIEVLLIPLVWDSKRVGWGCSCIAIFLIAIAIERMLLEDHTLYWSRGWGGAGSLQLVKLFLSFAIDCWSVTCLKSHRNPQYIHRLVKLCILFPRTKICLVTVFRTRMKCIAERSALYTVPRYGLY